MSSLALGIFTWVSKAPIGVGAGRLSLSGCSRRSDLMKSGDMEGTKAGLKGARTIRFES